MRPPADGEMRIRLVEPSSEEMREYLCTNPIIAAYLTENPYIIEIWREDDWRYYGAAKSEREAAQRISGRWSHRRAHDEPDRGHRYEGRGVWRSGPNSDIR